MARRIWTVAVALAIGGAAVAGLLAMTGHALGLLRPALVARIAVSEMVLPQGFGIAPETVAEYLVERMQERAARDTALRLAFGAEGSKRLSEVAVPRLMNAGVIRTMMADVGQLADLLNVARFRAVAEAEVRNDGGVPLTDVALVLPGLLRAEAVGGGDPVPVTGTAAGLPALRLGTLEPGARVRLTLWLDRGMATPPPAPEAAEPAPASAAIGLAAPPEGPPWLGLRQGAALASAEGAGRVDLTGGTWPGADLEVLPLLRWTIMGLLLLLVAGAVVTLAMALAPEGGARRAAPVSRA